MTPAPLTLAGLPIPVESQRSAAVIGWPFYKATPASYRNAQSREQRKRLDGEHDEICLERMQPAIPFFQIFRICFSPLGAGVEIPTSANCVIRWMKPPWL